MPGDRDRRGRRAYLAAAAVVLLAYAVLLLVVPPVQLSFDEAKYLAIGRNVLDGLGPRTDFGELFLVHSPAWPVLLVAPHLALGADALTWGRLLDGVAALGCLALTMRLGWRIAPLVGLVAGVALAAWPMFLELSRTARLDVPQAALCLLFVEVGFRAAAGRSVRWALAAGLVLGLAFLVKESSLVLAPAPFIAAWVQRRRLVHIARAAGIVVLVAGALSAWWFAWVAQLSGRVYAVGVTARFLGPLAVAWALVAGVAIAAPWLAGRIGAGPHPRRAPSFRGRLGIGLAVAAAWVVGLGIAFAHSTVLAAQPLLNPGQAERYVTTWGSDLLVPIAFGAGAIVSAGLVVAGRRGPILPLAALATSASWVVLVVATGEPPRDLIAQVALLDVAAAAGWVAIARAIARRAARGAPDRGRWLPAGIALGAAAAVLVAVAGFRFVQSVRAATNDTDASAREVATAAIDAWIRANLPAGTTVAFGAVQGEEAAVGLDGRYHLVLLAPTLAAFSAKAPLGIAAASGRPITDLVALDRHPREDGFYALAASAVRRALVSQGVTFIVYVTGLPTASPSVEGLLLAAPGIARVETWHWPDGSGMLTADVFQVSPAALAIPTDHLYATADALTAIEARLQGRPVARSIAAALSSRIVLYPPSADDAAALARLHALAGE